MPSTYKTYQRSDKTGQLILEALAKLIQLEVRDPRLPKLVSLSHVVVSPDMSHAKVYLTVLGGEEEGKKAASVLNHAAGYLRTALAKQVNLRIAPRLHFIYDTELEKATHLTSLISHLEIDDEV